MPIALHCIKFYFVRYRYTIWRTVQDLDTNRTLSLFT